MTFKVSGQITMDGKQAKAELTATGKAVDKVTSSSRKLGTEGTKAGRGVRAIGQAADATEAELRQLAAAEQLAATEAKNVGNSGHIAAGQMGNLVAQFNDIGMMMMAGQDPLQLAVQQGTQITQVIGPMGATGAAKALKGAFLSMLSPINFVTIGAIAAGAAVTNWLTSASEEAETFEDRIEALTAAVDRYEASTQRATSSEAKLRSEFGSSADAMRVLADAGSKFDRADAINKLKANVAEIVGQFGEIDGGFSVPTLGGVAREFENARMTAREIKAEFGITRDQAEAIVNAMQQLGQAQGLREQVDAAAQLNNTFLSLFGTIDKIPAAFRETAAQARATATEAARLKTQDEARLGLIRAVGREWLASGQAYLKVRVAEETAARKMLTDLNDQTRLQALITQYGADSQQVAEFRAAAEREVFQAMVDNLDVSASLKAELMAAFDAVALAEGQTRAWAGAMSGVAAEIQGILSALASIGGGIISNAAKAVEIEALRSGKSVADARIAAAKSEVEAEYKARELGAQNWFDRATNWADREVKMRGIALGQELAAERAAATKREAENRKSGSGGGSGRSATDRERQAIERLIQREREQLEILRETDPLQKELIRNRELLSTATDAERAAITALISERLREKEAAEQAKETADFWKDSIYEGLEGAMLRGEGLADVLTNMVIPALLKAAILGEGPLGGLFGGVGILSLISPVKKADGGYITGPGGERDDKVPIMGSAGEFMVSAPGTRRYRHLLEHINAGGEVRGLADGGALGQSRPASGGYSPAGAREMHVTMDVSGARGDREIEQAGYEGMRRALEEYDRDVLPGRVSQIKRHPRQVG